MSLILNLRVQLCASHSISTIRITFIPRFSLAQIYAIQRQPMKRNGDRKEAMLQSGINFKKEEERKFLQLLSDAIHQKHIYFIMFHFSREEEKINDEEIGYNGEIIWVCGRAESMIYFVLNTQKDLRFPFFGLYFLPKQTRKVKRG